jgi:hypothetical protein
MWKYGFNPNNSNHKLFLKRNGGKIVALIIYIDDMIVTSNDEKGITKLQKYLACEFEMKDLSGLQ